MKTNVYYTLQCRLCKDTTEFVLREIVELEGGTKIRTNPTLSDEGIDEFKKEKLEDRFSLEYCAECDMRTVHEFMGIREE